MLISEDEHLAFKLDSRTITLRTQDNEDAGNLSLGFTRQRAQSLNENEARILLAAEWESEEDVERFLPSMTWWDACKEVLPPLNRTEPMIVGMDAATGRADSKSDCFAMVGITRHPNPLRRHNTVAIRFVKVWQAKAGKKIDFRGTEDNPGPFLVLKKLVEDYNIQQVAYDKTELHFFVEQCRQENIIVWFKPISQGIGSVMEPGRGIADKLFLDLIIQKRLAHDGDPTMRQHIDNADRKTDSVDRRIKIVKRIDSKKVDAVIAAVQASVEVLRLRL